MRQMVREGKPEKSWRHVVEAQTERLLERGDVAFWDVAGEEYFHRPEEVLVRVDAVDQLRKHLDELQASRVDRDESGGMALFRTQAGVHDAAALLQKVAGDPGAAAPNHVLFGAPRLRGCPGRPPFRGAPVALDRTGEEGTGVVIAVIDTGQAEWSTQLDWVRDHVDVGPDDIDVLDASQDGELDFEAGHGTFITGVIAQVAPGAKVLARKAVDTWGVTDDLAVAEAVRRAVADGAHIINLSLGGYTMAGLPPIAVTTAVGGLKKEKGSGVVFVAAAGNDAVDRPFYPAALSNVIGVAALGSQKRRAGFSNFGPWVDACAEGERLLSTFATGTVMTDSDGDGRHDEFPEPYAHWSGTSFAAPQVSAAIAARMSATGESAEQAAFALVLDPALPRRTGLGVQVQTNVRSHRARVGLP
jgi:subtilisin family serine protease